MDAWSKLVVFLAVIWIATTYDDRKFNRRCEWLADYIQRTDAKDPSA